MKTFSKLMLACIAVVIIIVIALSVPMLLGDNIIKKTFIIQDPADDARTFTAELSDEGYGNEDGDWAKLQLAPSYSFGLRFQNVTIPRYTTIKNAYIELYSIGTSPVLRLPNCYIYCDNVPNALPFNETRGVLDISGRTYTHAFVPWNTTVPYGKWIKTPSVTEPLQEIINNPQWNSGNAVAFLFVSQKVRNYQAAFDNYENGYPARLIVEWENTE
jgi:hypothetical protein